MNTVATLLMATTTAFVSTNVDGFALLLGFFSDPRYRGREIVLGQFASVAVQMAVSVTIMQSGWVSSAPMLGLAGMIPLIAGLRRIARLRDSRASAAHDEQTSARGTDGSVGRVIAVFAVTTSGAFDNMLVYASVLVGRTVHDALFVVFIFVVLTSGLCACAHFTARSGVMIEGIQRLAARTAPFMTTAIGLSLLVRFDTLPWIYSLA